MTHIAECDAESRIEQEDETMLAVNAGEDGLQQVGDTRTVSELRLGGRNAALADEGDPVDGHLVGRRPCLCGGLVRWRGVDSKQIELGTHG
jgi:hypothetical protein